MLHQLKRERVRLTPEQRAVIEQAVCRILLGEVDEVRVSRNGNRLRIVQSQQERTAKI